MEGIQFDIEIALADNHRVDMLNQMKGSYSFDYLGQDKREICIRLVNNEHSTIGMEQCVTVMVVIGEIKSVTL